MAGRVSAGVGLVPTVGCSTMLRSGAGVGVGGTKLPDPQAAKLALIATTPTTATSNRPGRLHPTSSNKFLNTTTTSNGIRGFLARVDRIFTQLLDDRGENGEKSIDVALGVAMPKADAQAALDQVLRQVERD